ncbi:hypothetical protein JZ751_013350 [Albula glossodonta]|uniref:Major facilitator superfamily associated domain-containing protein n=1 Tax=Albula glossodonta TaxID=121402 RepID=A0A8T2NXU9_9TELE|nr:hypothetical protein JZ751_013350 [Albula glossodonta]
MDGSDFPICVLFADCQGGRERKKGSAAIMKRAGQQWDVKAGLRIAGAFSFLLSCGRASLLPFLTLYLRHLGLTAAMAGIVMATRQLVTLAWGPASAYLARRHNRRRMAVVVSLLCSAGAALIFPFIPPAPGSEMATRERCNATQLWATAGDSGSAAENFTSTFIGVPKFTFKIFQGATLSPTNESKVLVDLSNKGEAVSSNGVNTSNVLTPRKTTTMPTSIGDTPTAVLMSVVKNTEPVSNEVDTTPALAQGSKHVAGLVPVNKTVEHSSNRGKAVAKPVPASKASKHPPTRGDGGHQASRETKSHVPPSGSTGSEEQGVVGIGVSDITSSPPPPPPSRKIRASGRGAKRKQQEEEEEEEMREVEAARYEFLGSLKVMDAQHQLFFLVLLALSLWEGAVAPLERSVDDGLYEYLDFVDAAERHRTTQAWGLLGAAGGACGAGLLVGGLGLDCFTTRQGSAHFYAYALLMAIAVPVAVYLPMYLNRKRGPPGRGLKAFRQVRGDTRAILCAVTAFLAGAATSAVDDFLLWQMEDHGSGEMQMAVALGAALLSQAVFHLAATTWPSRFLSRGWLVSAGTTSLGLQCLYYAFLWSSWSVLPAQALSFLSTGALWWSVEFQCEGVATPGTERHVRGIVRHLAAGMGAGLGSLAAGFTMDRFGAPIMFQGAATILLLWGLGLPFVMSRLPQRRRINYSRLLTADASERSESDSDQEQENDWLVKAMQNDKSTSSSSNNNNNGKIW